MNQKDPRYSEVFSFTRIFCAQILAVFGVRRPFNCICLRRAKKDVMVLSNRKERNNLTVRMPQSIAAISIAVFAELKFIFAP